MQTIPVSFVNVTGFSVVTTHYRAGSVRLRIDELCRAGIDADDVDVQPLRRNVRRRATGGSAPTKARHAARL